MPLVKSGVTSRIAVGNLPFSVFGPFGYAFSSPNPVVLDGVNTYPFINLSGVNEYTLTQDVYLASNSSVAEGVTLKTAGFRLFCVGTFTVTGIVANDGASGAAGGGGGTGNFLGAGSAGGAGSTDGVGVPGVNQDHGVKFTATPPGGGAGGDDSTTNDGGAGGTYTQAAVPSLYDFGFNVWGGTGGGGGASDSADATGGTGGGGGGAVAIAAQSLVNNGVIRALGGDGQDASGTGDNAGGGGGGSGGVILLLTRFLSGSGTVEVTGGAGGDGYGAGLDGDAGDDGLIFYLSA